MTHDWGTITVVEPTKSRIISKSRFTIGREKPADMKRPGLFALLALLSLFSISRTAAAQGDWVPNCAPGFSVMKGEKTVSLTNNSPNPEVLVVDLVSANWDATVKQWVSGKTYTLKLPAESGKPVSGHLSYVGCGQAPFYAVAFQIAILGAPNWLYQLNNNDPYALGEQGNLNCVINVASTAFDNYSSSFSNVGCMTIVPLTPKLATASSTSDAPGFNYLPANAMNPDRAAWMSTSSSTLRPEWLQYDYGAGVKVKVSAVRAYFVASRQASTFQGSNDGATWVTFGSWNEGKSAYYSAPWPGEVSYADVFPAPSDGYRYIRIYSDRTFYLYYSWLQFYGVVVR